MVTSLSARLLQKLSATMYHLRQIALNRKFSHNVNMQVVLKQNRAQQDLPLYSYAQHKDVLVNGLQI